MSHLDAALYYMETPTNHMHLALLLTFGPGGQGVAATAELLRERLGSAGGPYQDLRLVVKPQLWGLASPVMVDGGPLDLDYHIQFSVLHEPGDAHALNQVVENELSRPLDRTKPLWQVHLIDGLEDGGFAVLVKGHNAAFDGAAALGIALHLLDGVPVKVPERVGPSYVEQRLGAFGAYMGSWWELFKWPLRVVRDVFDPGREAVRLARLGHVPRPFTAPKCILSKTISASRAIARAEIPADAVREIRKRADCTGEDVLLTLVASSTRSLLLRKDALPLHRLVAIVPAAQTGEEWRRRSNNRLAFWFIGMATSEPDARTRLTKIAASARGARAAARVRGGELWDRYTGALLPGPLNIALRIASALRVSDYIPPLGSMLFSTLPGSRSDLYLGGAPVTGMWPFGPPRDGGSINVVMVNYGERTMVGAQGPVEMRDAVQGIVDGLPAALSELGVEHLVS